MTFIQRMALASLALLPVTALAQTNITQPDPASTQPAVATPAHVSAFTDYRAFNAAPATPAAHWRSANDEMGRLGGHMGQMQDAAAEPDTAMPASHQHHHHQHQQAQPQSQPSHAGHHMQHKAEGEK